MQVILTIAGIIAPFNQFDHKPDDQIPVRSDTLFSRDQHLLNDLDETIMQDSAGWVYFDKRDFISTYSGPYVVDFVYINIQAVSAVKSLIKILRINNPFW